MIDPATVERIKNTADIVDVVGDYVHLIRRGSNYMGLCPFHNERTPSFSVNKQRNFCYCFSCKKGGSPVNFIMEKEGLTYHEALLHLAKKYGIEVVEKELTEEDRVRQSERESMFVANEWAMHKMESDMRNTEEGSDIGLQYLVQRGVTEEAMKAFHLGYAIDSGHELTDAARKAGFNLEVFKKLGLIGTSQQGRDYDRFRGRVIFPILNTAGKVIAFGGRDLKGGLAKYINSPESELYKKSNELYGVFQAKSSIVSEDKCFLVEGYMDVIGMWQSGMKNVVASSGTALTDGQIAMIHRFTNNITLIYDGDAAGIKASLRGIDMLLSHKLNVKVMLLPDGDDPDSFARKHKPDEFREYVKNHETDIIRFKAEVLLNTVKNDPQNRINAVNSVVESIAHIPDAVSRDVYVQECSNILNIPEETIAKSVARARFKVVENAKKERLRKEFSNNNQQNGNYSQQQLNNINPQDPRKSQNLAKDNQLFTNQETRQTPAEGQRQQPSTKAVEASDNPLYPLEKEVIKHCVRYAFMQFCTYEEEIEQTGETKLVTLDVLSFVREELKDSDLKFTVEVFGKIFRILEEMRPDFERFLQKGLEETDATISKLRSEGIEQIGCKQLSFEEIRREEQKLEDELKKRRENSIRELTKDYPGRILGSHEDDEIRKITFELLFEKHQLSNIYLKDGNTEREEEKLSVLLVRAIDEWKNEIINLRIKELFRQFHNLGANPGNEAEQEKLQQELSGLIRMRSEMSKYIGDRILVNKK